MNERVSIEQMIAGSFIKYNKLNELIPQSYAGSNCEEVNFFIDLNSVLKQLYSIDSWTYKYQNRYGITATVLNMCAHYRDFFRAIGVYCNIYIIYGLNCPSVNDQFVKGYNSKFIEAYIKKQDTTSMIEDNLNVLNLICQYLPYIYFFNIDRCEVSSMIDYIINTTHAKEKNIENIILSKDVLALQLVPLYDARILRPSKTKDGDESFIVDNFNLWNHFIADYRKGKVPINKISNTFFQNILPMTRVPERGMFSILNIQRAFHVIDSAINLGFLEPNKFYNQSSINTVLQMLEISCNPIELEMRFKAINSHYQAMYVLPIEKPEFKRLRLVNLEDVLSLKEIISRYFSDIPIDLDRI